MAGSSTDGEPHADDGSLTIVVVSFHAESLLVQCLSALAPQTQAEGIETLVVRARREGGDTLSPSIRGAFPAVRFIDAPDDATVPRMRAIGIMLSRGRVVALIEDDCLVQEGWTEGVLRAHRGPEAAVGGAVEPGPYARGLDWGAFFCDYGRFMLPLPAGRVAALPGNNLSCKRSALSALPAHLAHDFQEVFAHGVWQQANVPMRMDPSVVVVNVNSWTWADVTSVPYHHGRAYAAQRLARQPVWRRVLMSLLALPLPALKIARVSREALSRRRFVKPLLISLPWVALLSGSWSLGESAGYLFGPGDSPSKWR